MIDKQLTPHTVLGDQDKDRLLREQIDELINSSSHHNLITHKFACWLKLLSTEIYTDLRPDQIREKVEEAFELYNDKNLPEKIEIGSFVYWTGIDKRG